MVLYIQFNGEFVLKLNVAKLNEPKRTIEQQG